MLSPWFVLVAAAFNLIGIFSYLKATMQGDARPNRVTWLLWALAPLIGFAAMLDEGVGLQSLMTFMIGFGPLLVFVASFVNPRSYWKITRPDYLCGALSAAALVAWLAIREGNVAILLALLADFAAALPTVEKAYRDPDSEHDMVFLCGAISAAITLLTVDSLTFAEVAFPAYILAMSGLLFVLVRFQPRRASRTSNAS
ncbi:MAG: hypothetical protein HYX32_10705 [Actinobacteria bacterium]|nr:hypothetical protein [Actinomycetota bacterium]